MPYLFEPEFDEIVGEDQSLDAFLELPSDNRMRARLTRIFSILSSKGRQSHAFYFAGVIAAAADRFESASNFLRAAQDSLADDDRDRNAIGYLHAVLTRLQLRNSEDFRLAQQELTTLLGRQPSPFEATKLTSERAALNLTGYLASCLLQDRENPILDPEHKLLTAAERDLFAARARLVANWAQQHPGRSGAPMLGALKIQIHTNIFCAAVATTGFFKGHFNPIEHATVIQAGKEIGALTLHPTEDHIVWLWVQLSSCMILDGPARRQRAEELAAAAKPKLDAIEATAEGTRLLLDRRIFSYVIEKAPQLIR